MFRETFIQAWSALRRPAQRRFLSSNQYESCTLASQTLGNCQADSPAPAGHQCHFTLKFSHDKNSEW